MSVTRSLTSVRALLVGAAATVAITGASVQAQAEGVLDGQTIRIIGISDPVFQVMQKIHGDLEQMAGGTIELEVRPFDVLRQQVLPPLTDAAGIVGVHLCQADDSGSRIETAEKKVRNQETAIPRWILLIEGIAPAAVQAGADQVHQALARDGQTLDAVRQAIYQLEAQRCKHPWG